MIVDAHLHCSGAEKSDDVLRSLDDAGVDFAVLLAPFLNEPYTLRDVESLRAANEHLANLVRGHEDRLIGFAVVNPLHATAADDLQHAIETLKLRGLKLVPTGWYPFDDAAHRVYERAASLQIPILFHSGIFIDGRSGRFCRPTFYEAVREHPALRVTLAHLGFPWCDEANAVGLIDRINGINPDDSQFRFDISFGAPPVGFAGRLEWVKGPDNFVRIAERILREQPAAHFALVGVGALKSELKKMIQTCGLSSRVHLAGLWRNMAEVYPAFDVLVQTSRSEGMPMALLEAMACGCPIMAVDVGGVAELIEVDVSGWICKPHDLEIMACKLIELLSEPETLKASGRAGRRRAETHFDIRHSINRTMSLFEDMARKTQKPQPSQTKIRDNEKRLAARRAPTPLK